MYGPLIDALASLSKSGGPYLGPKGGLWADPQHTVHWEGHHGAVEVEPHASTRMYPIHLHIEDAGNGEVKISPAKGMSGPTIPRESLNHLVNDLRGVVNVPKGHAHPGIAAVARGDAKMLGKGDDGVAFKHGDSVVKVSTTVPFQPFNQGHRTPAEAATMLKAQVDVGNHLADLGLPVVRSEFIRHGDKGFQIKPYVDIPPKLSREQLDEVQVALHAMHDKGYAMNDDIQAGELGGKMMFFDVGKAAKAKGEGQQSDKSRDIDRLRMLYQQNGQRFVNSREPAGKRMWSDVEGAVLGLHQGKGSVDAVKRNIERAADARRKDAHASLSGKELAAELEDIDMDVEWVNEDVASVKPVSKGSLVKGSHTPPETVRAAARRGLELRKKHGKGGLSTQEAGRQGIGSGVARASNLAAGDAVSTETLRRMVAFFSRHRKNKSGGEDDAGYIAWLLWGSDPGEAWAKRELAKVNSMEKGGPFQPLIDLLTPMLPGWLELPASYAKTLGAALEKGLSHRYIRRVPTGKTTKTGKVRYRYYYHAAHGGTVGNEDHFVTGASFKDDDGHWHITARDGDKITLRHDETGAEQTMTPKALREHLVSLHKDAIGASQARARQDIADAKASGASAKQVARLRERAARVGVAPSQGSDKPAMFAEGSYTSKKGNLKKVAVFTGRVDSDQFKALAANAKEHGGSYIRDAGGFVFMGDAGFATFMAAHNGEPGPVKTEAQIAPVSEPTPKAAPAEPQRKAPRIAKWTAPAFGSKPSVDTAEAAKNVRADIKAANKTGALPNGLKLSIRTDRYSMGSTLRISIEDAPFQVLNHEKLEREKNDPYTYNGLTILTPEAAEIQDRIKAIANAYNRSYGDNSEGLRDTRFYVQVSYGSDVTKRDRLAFDAGAKPIASAVAPLRSQVKPEDLAPKDAAAQVSKLRATAAKVRADADAELGKDRNVNTRRRAEMASGIIERAERQSKLADAIGRAADAIEAGEAPALAAMTSKAQAQVLQNVAGLAHRRSMSYGDWERSGAEGMHPPADVVRFIEKLPGEESSATLERMGITSVGKLQAAVSEWLRVTDPKGAAASGAAAAKRAEIEESNLMRQGIAGYFPTPKPIADKMVHAAHIEPGMTVLEPSAGSGRLADAAKAAGADVAVVERSSSLREHLKGKGYGLAGDDALSHKGQYDRVVMNPPFEGMQDVEHVRHAFDNNLKPGGRLVAIMGEGPFFREDKKAQAFREWLDANGGYSEKLPSGTFDSSGTQVSSRMIVVDKPKAEARASAPVQEKPVAAAQAGANEAPSQIDEEEAQDINRRHSPEVAQWLMKELTKIRESVGEDQLTSEGFYARRPLEAEAERQATAMQLASDRPRKQQRAKALVERVQEYIAAGGNTHIQTMTKLTPLSRPEHANMLSAQGGDVFFNEGGKKVAIVGQSLEWLAHSVGFDLSAATTPEKTGPDIAEVPAKPRKFDELMQRADALNTKLDAMTPAPTAPKLTTAATNFADDIPMSAAVAAHSGTSHVPERRGEQEREGYAAHLAYVRGQLAKHETPENREAVEQAFAEYRAGYASRYKAMLAAKSRVMSSMVTGPARFPTASNQKKGGVADSRTNDVVEWSEDQSKKLLKRFNPNVSGPISADRKDAVPAIGSEVDKLKARQSMMVAANKVYRSKGLSDDEKVAKLVELGVSATTARAQLKPDFAGRIGFPDYALVNNSANIRRLESRAESVATEQAKATTEHEFSGGRVVDDADANRVRIYHDSKPSADVIAKLKSSGFKWSPSEGAWQRQRNNAARYAAGVITGAAISKGPFGPLLDLMGSL